MVIRHPLVEDHYKNITPQTSTTNFLLSSVLPNQSTSNLKLEKKWRGIWNTDIHIEQLYFLYDLHSSSYKTALSVYASYTQFDELILFISFKVPECTEKASLYARNCFMWTVKYTLA